MDLLNRTAPRIAVGSFAMALSKCQFLHCDVFEVPARGLQIVEQLRPAHGGTIIPPDLVIELFLVQFRIRIGGPVGCTRVVPPSSCRCSDSAVELEARKSFAAELLLADAFFVPILPFSTPKMNLPSTVSTSALAAVALSSTSLGSTGSDPDALSRCDVGSTIPTIATWRSRRQMSP